MSLHVIDPLESVPNRPGMRSHNLAGSEHGFDSLFLAETEMEAGSTIPLHTHPVEEAWVVTDGTLTLRLDGEIILVPSGSVARVPPNVPHSVRNDGVSRARAITAAPWERATFFTNATVYLDGSARRD